MDFSEILSRAVDITDSFDIDFGGLPEDIRSHAESIRPHLDFIQQQMLERVLEPDQTYQDGTQALLSMEHWTQVFGAEAAKALETGDVVAIDGTPIIHHQRFLTGQVYACAIGAVTANDPLDLEATLIKVDAEDATLAESPSLTTINTIIEQASQVDVSTSWPMAFLEYQERKRAFSHESSFVIIDGPIVTLNLLTRHTGRQLYRTAFNSSRTKRYVGVIKDLHRSDRRQRFYARALKPGQLYIWNNLAGLWGDRYDDSDVDDLLNTVGKDILRGVYRPGQKAFAFECHKDDLPYIVPLLWIDRNNHVGYEIPFLLAQVDAKIRGRYRPSETMRAIESTLAGSHVGAFFDEIDERDMR